MHQANIAHGSIMLLNSKDFALLFCFFEVLYTGLSDHTKLCAWDATHVVHYCKFSQDALYMGAILRSIEVYCQLKLSADRLQAAIIGSRRGSSD